MIYAKQVTTPANTAMLDAIKSTLRITKGLIYRVEFHFPLGSAGLMGVMITDGNYQLWPSSVGEWFTGDQIVIAFDDVYLKEASPFEFQIYTYNLDDTYEHLINIRIGLLTKELFQARFLPSLAYKDFTQIRKEYKVDP